MRSKGYAEHHQNNNLKVIVTFSNLISSFYDINKTEQILEFLNQKVKR
jgi:hypothetical protein